MKRFAMRRLITVLAMSGAVATSSAFASAFQLWEQDAASLGNYHAGYAATANNAATAWYNPAGITRISNQQIVFGADPVLSDFKYQGSVTVTNRLPAALPPTVIRTRTFNSVTAQGGVLSVIPFLHYVAPLNERLGFGFSVDVPFGLKTDYGRSTPLQYTSTLTSITVVDISPSLGFKVTDKASIGAGFDIQRASAEFDFVGLSTPTLATATSTSKASDTGYGYHLGALYEFTPETRAGISYHSQVVHHLSGNSTFEGSIVSALSGGTATKWHATGSRANITLPPYTALSGFHKHNQWGFMGSIVYTQWSTFKTLTLTNVAATVPIATSPFSALSRTVEINLEENYRNTWNVSLGTEYYATNDIILRGGLGYDQTPVKNAYRNTQLPDNNRYVIALGGHYQASKTLGLDVGWNHLFMGQARVAPPPAQSNGAQVVQTSGHVNGGADVFGAQVIWDIV